MKQKFNRSRIQRILDDLPKSIPGYLSYHAKQNEELAREVASFVRSKGDHDIPDAEFFHLSSILHNRGIIPTKDFDAISKGALHQIYRLFYNYLAHINIRALKQDCTFENVQNICEAEWSDDVRYLLENHLIDEEEHVSNTCQLFTNAKLLNYIQCIKSALKADLSGDLIFQLCVEITDDDIFNRALQITERYNEVLYLNVLKRIVRDLSGHSTRGKKYKAIQAIASGESENDFLLEIHGDPVYSYLKHEIERYLPSLLKTLKSTIQSDNTAKLSILAAFRNLSQLDRVHHYRRVLRDKDESLEFKANVIKELQNSSFLLAGKLLLEEHRVSGHSKVVNHALQIWCNKNQTLAADLFAIQRGLHSKNELVRIIAASSILGSVKTLLIILSNSPPQDTENLLSTLEECIGQRSESEKESLNKYISELMQLQSGIPATVSHKKKHDNILEKHLHFDHQQITKILINIQTLLRQSPKI